MIKNSQGKLIYAKDASGQYRFIDVNSYNLFNNALKIPVKKQREEALKSEAIKEVANLIKGKNCSSCNKKRKRK